MGFWDRFKGFFRGSNEGALARTNTEELTHLATQLGQMAQRSGLDENTVLQRVYTVSQALVATGDYDPVIALRDAMRTNVWVGRTAQLLGDATSSLAPRAQIEVDEVEERYENLPRKHGLSKFLKMPAPKMPWPIWCRQHNLQLVFRGVAEYAVVRDRTVGMSALFPKKGLPVELHLLEPRKTDIRYDKHDNIVLYRDRETHQEWLPEDVYRNYYASPYDSRAPIAPYEWTRHEASQDIKATLWNLNAFQNRLAADAIIKLRKSAGPENPEGLWDSVEDFKMAKAAFMEAFLGAENARFPVITGEEIEVKDLPSASHVDMDFGVGRQLTREGTIAGLGCPPMLAGVMDAAALNNFKIAKQVFYELTVIPFWELLSVSFNTLLIPEWGDDLRAHWNHRRVPELYPRYRERLLDAAAVAKSGVPWSELNRELELGFEEWPGWDKPWSGSQSAQEMQVVSEEDRERYLRAA